MNYSPLGLVALELVTLELVALELVTLELVALGLVTLEVASDACIHAMYMYMYMYTCTRMYMSTCSCHAHGISMSAFDPRPRPNHASCCGPSTVSMRCHSSEWHPPQRHPHASMHRCPVCTCAEKPPSPSPLTMCAPLTTRARARVWACMCALRRGWRPPAPSPARAGAARGAPRTGTTCTAGRCTGRRR